MTRDELAKLLEYDPDTGAFRWKVNRRGTAKAGQEAGHINASGYRIILKTVVTQALPADSGTPKAATVG